MGLERSTEHACGAYTRRCGGLFWKLWPVIAGLPDRIVLLPGGRVWFVEFKAPGGRLRPTQRRIIDILRGLGFRVDVIDSVEQYKMTLDSILGLNR